MSLLHQTDQNILRIHRGVLLVGWPIFYSRHWRATGTIATGVNRNNLYGWDTNYPVPLLYVPR